MQIYAHCAEAWNENATIEQQSLALSPYLRFTTTSERSNMVCLTEQFEFSAAHRLHCKDKTDEENRQLFGKCNNTNGHGHNYVLEVSVEREIDDQHQQVIELNKLESVVKQLVIDRLDHKHLNHDVEYFANINPSVENIAIAIWHWLDGSFEDCKLRNVRVYETPKTWAEIGA